MSVAGVAVSCRGNVFGSVILAGYSPDSSSFPFGQGVNAAALQLGAKSDRLANGRGDRLRGRLSSAASDGFNLDAFEV
jgi:hypothetical protein